MMPGENQSGAEGIVSEATSGTCQNCTVLNQSLDEYVAALLTLKQKIIDTENAKLEETLKEAEDAADTLNLENTKLRSEKKMLESDLQKTLESLSLSQQAVEEVENLKLQNAKALILKSSLENQLLALEDKNIKQNHTIRELKSKNNSLEKSITLIEEKLATLEKEFNKEKTCSSTQTENEPKVDKAKVWTLLQEVWHCVDPPSKTPENLDLYDDQHLVFRSSRSPPCPLPISPFRNPMPQSTVSTPKGHSMSTEKSKSESSLVEASSPSQVQKKRKMGKKKKRSLGSEDLDESSAKTHEVGDLSLNKDGPVDYVLEEESCNKTPDIWEILSLSWPLPAPLSPLPPDELAVMEVDSSLKESSISKAEDGQKSQSAEPNPLEDSVAVSSVCLSPGNQLSMETSFTPDTDKKSLHRILAESQEMQVEKMCKISEDSPCTVAKASLQNESDGVHVGLNQTTIITAESQLSTREECTTQVNSKLQCNAGHEVPKANYNNGVRQGSEPVQQVILPEECPNKEDKSVLQRSEVKANMPFQISPTPQTCSKMEPERTVVEIQKVLTPVVTTTDLRTTEDQNSYDGKDNESSCTKINGVTSGESSDEEFLGLKRKVRGICSRTGNLNSITSSKPLSNEKQVSVDQIQGTHCETKEEHFQQENKKDHECLKDSSMTMNIVKPIILEDSAGVDVEQETELTKKEKHELENYPNNSVPVFDAHNQQIASSNALTSNQSPESIGKVLIEMGPPLPPVVLPLTATPPKLRKPLTPNRPSIQLPMWSSTERSFSFKQQSTVPSPDPGLQEEVKTSLSMTTPSPSHEVPSSPLQFGSATPKHALPVPGRLPLSALNSSSPCASQENSMQMLDTMYPELSAQARTLNILRGNVNLGRAANESGTSPPVNPISGNKSINSSSTAFTKTDQKAKRIRANVLLPKSAKRLRLDTCSPDPSTLIPPVQQISDDNPSNGVASPKYYPANGSSSNNKMASKEGKTVDDSNDRQSLILSALAKLQNSYFDVLPIIKSHVFLGRISDVPVLRDEEKYVISDFCLNQSSAEGLMLAILSKIKAERAVMKQELLQSHCRVYVGLCRWRGDCQKAHSFAYSLLKEDFPDAPKLILFLVTTWPTALSYHSPLCRAINIVSKLKAEGEILDYLSKYLHWDERPPGDIYEMITSILNTLLEDSTLKFQKHDRHGDDLCSSTWEYIFSLDLLCAQLGWKWTHDNIIGKQLWPVMNAWVMQPRTQQTPVRDICVAAVLRLIGRLGQLGLKENLCMSVQNVAKAINLFGKHGISEGVPWEVQLSAVYTIYDLAPSNPKEALEALASWRGEITQPVPPAVTSCITQIGSICRQIKS
ncbi:little elongation complex subunit 1 isoform X2 [Neoarius graeffei]|uniref:little elongation complex subunit 1 isoform X2 n=1 Tax=Neoarius graeffei TaxID=443677 RepID=UPI00298C3535|nr:little elongation complex subunit 1 isoform X2 [Neoarius graeffei]